MATSDSEGFESADEGHNNLDKNARKQRLSSSNYSDKTSESDAELKKPSGGTKPKDGNPIVENPEKATDGWDDFDIEDTEPIVKPKDNTKPVAKKDKFEVDQDDTSKENLSTKLGKVVDKCKDTGWDDFDDWGEVDDSSSTQKIEKKQPQPDKQTQQVDKDIREVTERLAAASTNTQFANQGWGWGWGVDSLLSSASAGFTTITNQVSQGISTVLESGIGAPDPEELARKAKESEAKSSDPVRPDGGPSRETEEPAKKETNQASGDAAFPFGNLLSGVTKFVESTGTKVIAGGLDTLETIGKKTMEVLQDGDPGLAKKRAMLGLDTADKPVLSQVLREAKAKAEEEDRIKEDRREAKEVHYENLFDDFEGLVHLEALEMLSRQVRMRIEERLRAADADKRQDLKETLQQVAELCEMPEEEEDEEDSSSLSKPDAFHERLQTATQDLGLKLQFQPLVKQYTEIVDYLSTTDTETTEKAVYKRAVGGLAQATALSVEIYHKTGEMLLVKPRRSTADEADALTQMTVVLSKHISELATLFTEKLNSLATENKDQVNTYITNIFLEAGNSSSYVQNAFQLTLPILQIGAV